MTLGLKLQKPGIFITYSKENPASTGGVAYFLFESSLQNPIRKYQRIWDANEADTTLDEYIEKLKTDGALSESVCSELETKISEALIAYGHKILANYQVVVRTLKDEIAKFVVTGGEPVYSKGQFVGIQNFNLTQLKNES